MKLERMVPTVTSPGGNGTRSAVGRAIAAVLLAGSALVATGCFEEPVREELTLSFTSDGKLVARWRIRLTVPEGDASNEALEDRLADLDRALAGGWHPWLRRFDQLDGPDEGASWRRQEGRLTEFERWEILDDPAAITSLFAGSSVAAFWEPSPSGTEVAFYPGSSSATREERERVESALEQFTVSVAGYLEAGNALWAYLERHPRRRRACFAALFDLEEAGSGDGGLQLEETGLVEALSDRMGDLLGVLVLRPGEAVSLDELSRRVYDPLPLDVVIEPPRRPRSVEGFLRGEDGRLRSPRLGIWAAFTSLEGRWLAPDPALAFLRHERSDGERPFPLADFLARPARHARAPAAFEVHDALRKALQPLPAYRVAW